VPLDFASGARLFMGTDDELARALGMQLGDVRALRNSPADASPETLSRLGQVLVERGRGMTRVGELLLEGGGELSS
jgi:hypothetical protein